MHLSEFKAWFEGFTENMNGETPTDKQWKRIKAKIGEIDNDYTLAPVFIDWPRRRRYWDEWHSNTVGTPGRAMASLGRPGASSNSISNTGVSREVWVNAGRAEYSELMGEP